MDDVKKYLELPFITFVVPDITTEDEPCYLAYHPEIEGCMSHGATPEEAMHNLGEATELYVSVLLEKGLKVPAPDRQVATWDFVDVPAPAATYYIPEPTAETIISVA